MAKKRSKSGEISMGFHAGRIVQYLAATYGRLDQVVGELVQNFLDAHASEAHILIDTDKRELRAWDNGEGASKTEMGENFMNIGAPRKERLAKRKGPMIGRRSIGNLAPIALKGEKSVWTFTSHKPKSKTDNKWYSLTLNMKGLENKKDVGLTPLVLPPGFKPTDHKGAVLPGVTTTVHMTDIESAHLKELERTSENPASIISHTMSEMYSASLLRKKTRIVVWVVKNGQTRSDIVKPQRFPGDKREVSFDEVSFEIYATKTPIKKKIKIFVEHEGLVSFSLNGQRDLWELVQPVLGSGHFQGIIRTNLGELTPSRRKFAFNKDYNRFCDAVIRFVTEHAEPWLNEIKEETKDDRVAKIIGDVLEKVAPLVDDFPELAEVFRAAKNPVGHPTVEDKKDGLFHLAVTSGTKRGERKRKPGETPEPTQDPPDYPRVIRGGRVLRHTCGMAIKSVDADPTHPWGVRWRARVGDTGLEKGILLLNRSHADFAAAHATGDASGHTYILLITLGVMAGILTRSKEKADSFRDVFETYFLTISTPLVPRIPSFAKHGARRKKK